MGQGSSSWLARATPDSEVGRLIRETDWASTPLGPPDAWPQHLRHVLATCLRSRFPMMITWGPEFTQLYNDAYIPQVGGKHPQIGRPVAESWDELWDVLEPMLTSVLAGGEAVFAEDGLQWVDRTGFPEDTYWTFSLSPIVDADGTTGGVLVTTMETTQHVLSGRRLRAVDELSVAVARATTSDEVVRRGVQVLDGYREDLPFVLAYLREPETGALRLVARAGMTTDALAPAWAVAGEPGNAWPLDLDAPQIVDELASRGAVHALSGKPVDQARVTPLRDRGLLIAGLSPTRRIDEHYLQFLDLIAAGLLGGIEAAEAFALESERADALADLDRAKTEFLQNASHELRTPLTLIRAPVEDLIADRDPPLSPRQRAKAELVARNTDRLLRLVNGLLDFSQVPGERLQSEPTDLGALTAQLVALFEPTAHRAGLELTTHLPAEPLEVEVDREVWERIVLNLVSNALKFTAAGFVRVELAADGDTATLVVADSGPGIAPSDLERVFARFARIATESARSHEGAGIGLALVRELARRLGGDATVASTPGQGSRFTVRVRAPRVSLATGDGANAAEPSPAAAALAAEVDRWHPASPVTDAPGDVPLVIYVDDSADMRDYVVSVLGRDHRVVTAGDGVEALEAIRRERPALVLADIMMPRMNGLELVRAVRADALIAGIPIMLLSARAGDEASAEGLASGADDYLVKPFSARELRARVTTHVELARARAEIAAAEHELQAAALVGASERRLRAAISAAGTGIALGDTDGRITDANPALCQLLRRSAEQMRHLTLSQLCHPEDVETVQQEGIRLRAGQVDHSNLELRLIRGDDEPIWAAIEISVGRAEDGSIAHFVASIRDAGERRRDESRLRHLADHDALTGLLNRRRFGEELDRVIEDARRHGTRASLLLLDLDGLKAVNDLYGHAAGDKLLCGIADLARGRLREGDVLGRLGGDEFALLLPGAELPDAEAVARDLQHRIRQAAPVLIGGMTTQLTASVGIAPLYVDGRLHSADELMLEADEALYDAKRAGRDRIRSARGRIRTDPPQDGPSRGERVRAALSDGRFELFCQPIVGIHGDERRRYELLLRLHGQSGELLNPGSFLPDAERSELIVEIDTWVIRRSAQLLADLERELGHLTLHVNLSARTITQPGTADLIIRELELAGVDGHGIVYEITETTAITSIDRAQEFAARVRQAGCGLALDDFGAGFASFSYLQHLDYDYVKIDSNLIQGAASNPRDRHILRCLAEMARGMGKMAIAEGVDDGATLELLREFGVDYAQGFLLGRPRPVFSLASVG